MERETAVAIMRVEDAETVMMKELKDMTTSTGKPQTTIEQMLNGIGDTLSDRASSNNEEDGEHEEDDEEDTELGKLSDDDEPGWVMGTISKTVQHRMESFRQKQMRLDKLTQPGWGDAVNNFCERDMKYGMTELKVPAVVTPQIDMAAVAASLTTAGENMQTPDIVRGQLEMPAVPSQPGSSQMRLGSEKRQSNKFVPVLFADTTIDSTLIQDTKPVEPISFYLCMKHS